MDIRSELRELVSGRYMPNFDYIRRHYAFDTVFERTMYSYCCCECGFQHECLDYISENGEVDEEVFSKIVQCVEDGKCPHVNESAEEFVRETGINAIHIAAATGTTEAVKGTTAPNLKTNLYRVEPHVSALLKNKPQCVDIYFDLFESYAVDFPRDCLWGDHDIGFFMLYAYRSSECEAKIKIKRLSLIEFCVKKRSTELLKSILRTGIVGHPAMHNAYELAFKQHLTDIQDILIKYDNSRCASLIPGDMKHLNHPQLAIPAILCDQPPVLDTLRNVVARRYRRPGQSRNTFAIKLQQICLALKRRECLDILWKRKFPEKTDDNLSTQIKVNRLLDLFTFHKEFRHEILASFKEIPDLASVINTPFNEESSSSRDMVSWLHSYFVSNDDTGPDCSLDPEVIKALLQLGVNINATDTYGKSPLICFLEMECWWCHDLARECLEVLIYENPSFSLNAAAVSLGLQQDEFTCSWNWCIKTGHFLMDVKEHSHFGHDGSRDYALNFTAPLLIECGFPVTRDTLQQALDKKALAEVELSYIQTCFDVPRSLTLRCRDALRTYFKGKTLHKFIETLVIPKSIKDFVLLKSELRCVI